MQIEKIISFLMCILMINTGLKINKIITLMLLNRTSLAMTQESENRNITNSKRANIIRLK